ncbi:MAG: prolyl oligopeptidase family serine peptidase [Pseudonocardia sp.]|nr:prolyl oligopeptidase family serine peptidase [Pseudonocardia sp.]
MTTTDRYPTAPRLDLVDDLHGHRIADPYRWLEDTDDPRTREWSRAQDALAAERLAALPGRATLRTTLERLTSTGSVQPPVWKSGRRFVTRRDPGQDHAVLHVVDPDGSSAGGERVLLDPMAIDPTGRTTLDGASADPTGRLLAYQLSFGGDEQSVLHVMDVDTGEEFDEPIDRCRYSAIAWLPAGAQPSSEFLYVRMVAEDEVPPGQQVFHRRIWRHRVGTPTSADVLVEGPGLYEGHTYYDLRLSHDGRWLVVTGNVGTARRDSVWIAELPADGRPVPALTPVLAQADDVRASMWVERDGRLYVRTTDGAPRWRLAVTDPRTPGREHWRELVAEDPESNLDAVRYLEVPGGEAFLVLARSRHAVGELVLHGLDGAPRGPIGLPGPGSLVGLSVADSRTPEQFGRLWLGWTDFVTPVAVHRYEAATGQVTLEATAPGAGPVPPVRSEQRTFTSADGTTVRMFVLSRDRPEADRGPVPTLMTGYGGFALAREPEYSATALAWIEAGGAYVVVSLRGGSEEGECWHLGGNRGNKQNVFDDFHAAAQALITAGTTTPDRLAILGGSNGGLLVGAALTQRPQLYRAVVCSAPLLDMVRYERFSLGRTWNDEYGTAADPEQLGWLLGYSPYHHVVDGAAYPAVLFTVFESDTRVDPCHARKMCAALQHATAGDDGSRPVLLRRETDVGHGARSVSRTVALAVDQLAFLACHTGLDLS